jgi:hypothetical protein
VGFQVRLAFVLIQLAKVIIFYISPNIYIFFCLLFLLFIVLQKIRIITCMNFTRNALLLILSLSAKFSSAQHIYKVKTDSLLVTNDSCTAELILENSTKNVKGFLYNKGRGRTEFRKALTKLSGNVYLIGEDTLNTSGSSNSKTILSGLQTTDTTILWGGDTLSNSASPSSIKRPTVLRQNAYPFQWITGSYSQLHITNQPYTPYNQSMPLGNSIPFRISHNTQGFLYLENNFQSGSTYWNAPTFGILWGNRDPLAQTYTYFGQKVQAGLIVESLGYGPGGTKDIPTFTFTVAGDTIVDRAVQIIGTGTSKYAYHKLPTLSANYRFSIGGRDNAFAEGNLYPYTRFYANAENVPFVWKNLPWKTPTTGADTVISIDYDGNIRQKALPETLSASATFDFPNTTSGNSSDLTITVTGAADGDVVALGVSNTAVSAKSCFTAWVSAANTVSVRFNNYSSASINPPSANFKIKVLK